MIEAELAVAEAAEAEARVVFAAAEDRLVEACPMLPLPVFVKDGDSSFFTWEGAPSSIKGASGEDLIWYGGEVTREHFALKIARIAEELKVATVADREAMRSRLARMKEILEAFASWQAAIEAVISECDLASKRIALEAAQARTDDLVEELTRTRRIPFPS